LASLADTALENSKDPKNIITLTALNKAPAGFEQYDIGDVVSLVAPSYGFGGTHTEIRIMSREYSPRSGICSLVVEEQI